MEQKIFKSINGNDFIFRYIESNFISPWQAGYIITPNGEFIPYEKNEDHSAVFSSYLTKYLDREIDLETIEATKLLVKNMHIVYMGLTKTSDLKDELGYKGSSEGCGLLIFPQDTEEITPETTIRITPEQKIACELFIGSNKRLFSDEEKVPMQYHSLSFAGSKEYTKDDILGILESKSRHM